MAIQQLQFGGGETGKARNRASLLEGLFARRSISPKRLIEPGPDTDEIRQIVAAALTAPDHCGLRPWRFIHIAGSSRAHLGEVFAAIKARRDADASPEQLERERDRACGVPAMIAIVARLTPDHPRVRVCEQHASVGAAIQNMLLCAHALGYGAKMVSGHKVLDPQLTAALGVQSVEQLFGFVCLGTPIQPASPRTRPSVDDHLSFWRASSRRT